MAKAGDPITQHYFRLDDILYRSTVELSEDCAWVSRLERYSAVWEEVPNSREVHTEEKKAAARAKKLTNVLEHTPIIYLAYWNPKAEDEDGEVTIKAPEKTTKFNIRINASGESYLLYNSGDFVIEQKGGEFIVSRWTGFDVIPVGKPLHSLEAACLAAVVKAREEILEKQTGEN